MGIKEDFMPVVGVCLVGVLLFVISNVHAHMRPLAPTTDFPPEVTIKIPRARMVAPESFIESVLCKPEGHEGYRCVPSHWLRFSHSGWTVPLVPSANFTGSARALVCAIAEGRVVADSCWLWMGQHGVTGELMMLVPTPELAQSMFYTAMTALTVVATVYFFIVQIIKIATVLKGLFLKFMRMHLRARTEEGPPGDRSPENAPKVRFSEQELPTGERAENRKVRREIEKKETTIDSPEL